MEFQVVECSTSLLGLLLTRTEVSYGFSDLSLMALEIPGICRNFFLSFPKPCFQQCFNNVFNSSCFQSPVSESHETS